MFKMFNVMPLLPVTILVRFSVLFSSIHCCYLGLYTVKIRHRNIYGSCLKMF
jgi:hypothetical protein